MPTSSFVKPTHHLPSVQPSLMAHNQLWNEFADQLALHKMLLVCLPILLADQFQQPWILHLQFSHIHHYSYRNVAEIPLVLDPKQYSPQFSPPNCPRPSPSCSPIPGDQHLQIRHPTSRWYLYQCLGHCHH